MGGLPSALCAVVALPKLTATEEMLNRWDNRKNKPWNSMGRAAKVGQGKLLNLHDLSSPLLGTTPRLAGEA